MTHSQNDALLEEMTGFDDEMVKHIAPPPHKVTYCGQSFRMRSGAEIAKDKREFCPVCLCLHQASGRPLR